MRCFTVRNRIRIDYGFFYLAAILLLMLPLRWVAAGFLAAIFHELGHFTAVRFLGGRVFDMDISFCGAKMHASVLPTREQLLCLLAGPAASLLLILTWRFFPRLAICGFLQGIYNLIPFRSMDGAQILGCLRLLLQKRKEKFLAKRQNK